jgi:hypothetical protein
LLLQLIKTSFVGWCPLELLILPKQLGHGIGDLWESFDEPSIISYYSKKLQISPTLAGAFKLSTSWILLGSTGIPPFEIIYGLKAIAITDGDVVCVLLHSYSRPIIDEYHKKLVEILHKDLVHQIHKVGQGISQYKRHQRILVQTIPQNVGSIQNVKLERRSILENTHPHHGVDETDHQS